ncbi:MAG: hypothetical protein Q9161_002028 [Pseudevernia consocians]
MERQGPRFRGGPPGRYGDGTNRLSDAEDSVVWRKQSILGRRQELEDQEDDDLSEYTDDYETCDCCDDDGMSHGRRSTRGGPQGRQGAGSRYLDDEIKDMDMPPCGARCGGANGSYYVDPTLGYLDPRDLPKLRKKLANTEEEFLVLCKGNCHRGSRDSEDYFHNEIERTKEDIERHEYAQRESGKTPRRMGPSTHMTDPNPRPSRAGGRLSFEKPGELFDHAPHIPTLSDLKKKRVALKNEMLQCGNSGPLKGARREEAKKIETKLFDTTEAIKKLEFEDYEDGRIPRRMRELFRPRGPEDYSDEESDGVDYQPRGSRRG